jgi:hypothetical protein
MTKLAAAYTLGLGLIKTSGAAMVPGTLIATAALSGVSRARPPLRSARVLRAASAGDAFGAHVAITASAWARASRRVTRPLTRSQLGRLRARSRPRRRLCVLQFFVVGVDCSRRSFFPYKALNDFVGFLVLLPLLRSASSIRDSPKVRRARRRRRRKPLRCPPARLVRRASARHIVLTATPAPRAFRLAPRRAPRRSRRAGATCSRARPRPRSTRASR